ncbi:MAG TPA: hypothetical protein VJJ82_03940 [Candidatus Nanoarchaeia archaeon]|nr:hypothetical protein [Candidatus Nanoarchaeia archaeon]
MKKQMIVMALIVAMVPFAFAEYGDDRDAGLEAGVGVAVGAHADAKDVPLSSKAESESKAEIFSNDEREARQAKQDELKREREIKLGKQVKEIVQETRADLKGERVELRAELKADLKECAEKKTRQCEETRTHAKLAVKDLLISASEKTDTLIESIKQMVASSQLSNKAEITAKLDAQILEFAKAKASVESLSQTSTKKDITAATAQVRAQIEETKLLVRHETSLAMSKQLGGVLQKSKNLQARLDDIVAKLEARGVEVSSIDTATFKAKLSAAEEMKVQADVQVEAAAKLEGKEKGQALKEVAAKLRESHKLVKEAHAELKRIVAEIKSKSGGNAAVDASASAQATVAGE